MKKWNNPSLEELDLNATAYSPAGGSRVDGAYNSNDGKFYYPTYGPSGGADDGNPHLTGNDPSIVPAGGNGSFTVVD